MIKLGRCGRIPSRNDARSLRLADFLSRDYDAPPPARDYVNNSGFGWYLNNQLGTCTIAGICKIAERHAELSHALFYVNDDEVRRAYSAISGYDGTPKTDRGAQMLDALRHAQNVGIGGFKIGPYMRVNVRDPLEMQAAINVFGAVYVGAALPRRVYSQPNQWSLTPMRQRTPEDKPGSLGGHAFVIMGYERSRWRGVPWNRHIWMTDDWVDAYVDEGWAFVHPLWVSSQQMAPNGFDLSRVLANVAAIKEA